MRDRGYMCEVVERWNPHARVRRDMFGFIDILAIKGDSVVGVQTTTSSNMQSRIKKIIGHPNWPMWCGGNRTMAVHGWAKRGPRGKRKVWTVTELFV